jgi:hypothetical protein
MKPCQTTARIEIIKASPVMNRHARRLARSRIVTRARCEAQPNGAQDTSTCRSFRFAPFESVRRCWDAFEMQDYQNAELSGGACPQSDPACQPCVVDLAT